MGNITDYNKKITLMSKMILKNKQIKSILITIKVFIAITYQSAFCLKYLRDEIILCHTASTQQPDVMRLHITLLQSNLHGSIIMFRQLKLLKKAKLELTA